MIRGQDYDHFGVKLSFSKIPTSVLTVLTNGTLEGGHGPIPDTLVLINSLDYN